VDDEFIGFQAVAVPDAEYDKFATGDPGTRGIATSLANLRAAVDMLVDSVGVERLRKLKIRSGEHLAAIVTTCFLGSAPTQLDSDGGSDLVFDDYEATGWRAGVFSSKPPAFEVKSLDGDFREFDSYIDRTLKQGGVMIF
jgi:hypothetical protein